MALRKIISVTSRKGKNIKRGARSRADPSALDFSRQMIPYERRGVMRYAYTWNNSTGNPGFYDWVIRGNDIYDPDVALGGNSATGLDNLADVYSYYKVIGSRIKADVWGYDGNNQQVVVIIPNDTSASFTLTEWPALMNHPMASKPAYGSIYTGPKRTSHSMSTALAAGVKDVDDVGFQASTAGSPTHQWYWHVVSSPLTTSSAKSIITVLVEYDTLFFSPKQLDV